MTCGHCCHLRYQRAEKHTCARWRCGKWRMETPPGRRQTTRRSGRQPAGCRAQPGRETDRREGGRSWLTRRLGYYSWCWQGTCLDSGITWHLCVRKSHSFNWKISWWWLSSPRKLPRRVGDYRQRPRRGGRSLSSMVCSSLLPPHKYLYREHTFLLFKPLPTFGQWL